MMQAVAAVVKYNSSFSFLANQKAPHPPKSPTRNRGRRFGWVMRRTLNLQAFNNKDIFTTTNFTSLPTRLRCLEVPTMAGGGVAADDEAKKKQQEEEEEQEELKKRKEKEEKELPPPPEKPLPGDCCGSGCVRCVWDIYYEELEDYNNLLNKNQNQSVVSQSSKS